MAPERIGRVLGAARRLGTPEAAIAELRARMLAPGESAEDYAYEVDAGDLDHDGFMDLLDVRMHSVGQDQHTGFVVYQDTTSVVALRGRDGKTMWSRTFSAGNYVQPIPARVGAAGTRGVIFADYAGSWVGPIAVPYAGNGGLTVTAVDGAGRDVWSRAAPGAWAGWSAGGHGYAVVADALDAAKGPATDVLVTVTARAAAVTSVEVGRVLLVSGTDGSVADTGIGAVQREGFVTAAALPDLDHDGLADVALLSGADDAKTTTVAAYRPSGGTPLWTSTVPIEEAGMIVPVGDATGDRTTDLAVVTDPWAGAVWTSLVDGHTGAHRWAKPGYPVALGSVGGRAIVGVLRYGTRGQASVQADAYDGAGKARWHLLRSLPAPSSNNGGSGPPPPPQGVTTAAASGCSESMTFSTDVETYLEPGGDMNGDGVTDLGYAIVVTPRGKPTRRDEGWVDGRTGAVRRGPAPDLVMLRGTVDGHGADQARAAVAGGRLTVTVYSGDRGRLLSRTTVAVGACYTRAYGLAAVNLTRRHCADVLVDLDGGRTIQTIVFDGTTGAPRWSITRDGTSSAAKLVMPAVRGRTDRNGCR